MRERPQQSYLGKILLIAWREFRHTALTKGFIFGAVALPVIMFGVIAVIPKLLTEKSPPLVGEIVVIDPTGTVLPRAQEILARRRTLQEKIQDLAETPPADTGSRLEAAAELGSQEEQRIEVTWRAAAEGETADGLKALLAKGSLIAGASIGADTLDPSKEASSFEIFIPSSLSPKHVGQVSRALRKAVEEERIARSGVDKALLARLSDLPAPRTLRISPEGSEAKENTELRFIVPAAFMFLLWICVFTSANYLLTTTIEEKSNKVMEVLLAAASPMQLLAGKILGYSAVSAVMLVMYGGLGVAGLSAAAMMDLVPVLHLVYLGIFFIMAYFMVASMMSAVGSGRR